MENIPSKAATVEPGAPSNREMQFVHRVVEPYAGGPGVPCMRNNPGCGRDPWWVARGSAGSSDLVQYRFIGPGLVSDARFTEAIWLLWSWGDGARLLATAGDHEVTIEVKESRPSDQAFGWYSPFFRRIQVGSDFIDAPTWLLGALLANELQHAEDDRWDTHQGRTEDDCVARERRAYATESRFVAWLVQLFGAIPTVSDAQKRYSAANFGLFLNVAATARSDDIQTKATLDYQRHC